MGDADSIAGLAHTVSHGPGNEPLAHSAFSHTHHGLLLFLIFLISMPFCLAGVINTVGISLYSG